MLPDRVSNPGPLTYESGALPIALRGPALEFATFNSLVLTNTLSLQDGHGTAQMGNTTTRLITSW